MYFTLCNTSNGCNHRNIIHLVEQSKILVNDRDNVISKLDDTI